MSSDFSHDKYLTKKQEEKYKDILKRKGEKVVRGAKDLIVNPYRRLKKQSDLTNI